MEIDLATPALLFPAISLLLLAYTNRFLALAALIRALHERYQRERDEPAVRQIEALRNRVLLIRAMQQLGVGSFLLCVICMFTLFAGWTTAGKVLFGASLVLMMLSLLFSLREIQLSVNALNIQLSSLQCRDQELDTRN